MKKQILSLFVVCVFAIQPCLTSAQSREDPFTPKSTSAAEVRFDLDFPGGTISDLINQISKAIGQPAPVLASKEAREAPAPPIKLISTTVNQVFEALVFLYTSGEIGLPTTVRKTNSNIWIITDVQSHSADHITRIFQISSLLGSFQLEDITTAIETVWQMSEVSNSAKMRFHEETDLLIIRGNMDQIDLVEETLGELRLRYPHIAAKEAEARRMQKLKEDMDKRKQRQKAIDELFKEEAESQSR